MNTIVQPEKESFAERFREPGETYLSPRRFVEQLDVKVQTLARKAHVSRNAIAARPQSEQLQQYMRAVVRVLAAAEECSGDQGRAVFWFFNEPLREFGFKTADDLVAEGKADVVIAYLESIMAGATG